jgi:hypothetical protein
MRYAVRILDTTPDQLGVVFTEQSGGRVRVAAG